MMQAEAFATEFASTRTCDCDVSVSAAAHVWDEIWAEAVVNAYAETCSGALFAPTAPSLASCAE